jgi:hypothetical protein
MNQRVSHGDVGKRSDEDARKWKRYAAIPEEVVLSTPAGALVGVLIDESIGGISVLVKDGGDLHRCTTLAISYRSSEGIGYVKAIRKEPDGQYRVCIGWNGTPSQERVHFFTSDGLKVACELIESERDRGRIRLWNGKEFSVPNHTLTPHTMAERELELTESGDNVSIVARLYGLCGGKPTQALVKDVLAFEFRCCQRPPENRNEVGQTSTTDIQQSVVGHTGS